MLFGEGSEYITDIDSGKPILVCLRYSGSVGILIEKLWLEEENDSRIPTELSKRLYISARSQGFPHTKPEWPWLHGIIVCSFVAPAHANDIHSGSRACAASDGFLGS